MKVSSISLKQLAVAKRKTSLPQELIDKFLPIVKSTKLNHLTIIELEPKDGIAIKDAKKAVQEASKQAKRYFTIRRTSASTLTLKRIAAKVLKDKLKKKKVSKSEDVATQPPRKVRSAKMKKSATKAKAKK